MVMLRSCRLVDLAIQLHTATCSLRLPRLCLIFLCVTHIGLMVSLPPRSHILESLESGVQTALQNVLGPHSEC